MAFSLDFSLKNWYKIEQLVVYLLKNCADKFQFPA